jgi:hypothetical protein
MLAIESDKCGEAGFLCLPVGLCLVRKIYGGDARVSGAFREGTVEDSELHDS